MVREMHQDPREAYSDLVMLPFPKTKYAAVSERQVKIKELANEEGHQRAQSPC
jgi:hypothetical protein